MCGNAPNTGGSESGPLPLRDKHHTSPSSSWALQLSTECTFVAFFLNKKYKMQSESRGVGCHVLTWFLPPGAFVDGVALERHVDGRVEKKEETSVMELVELVFVCCGSAGRGCEMND